MEDLSSVIEAENIEKYVCMENMRTFGVNKEPDEDPFAKRVSVNEKAVVVRTSDDVSTCHRFPIRDKGPDPIIAKFVRRDAKRQLMKKKGI